MATKLVFCGKKVNLPAVREQAFYLTTDTHEVYFGQNLYTEPVRFVPERETTPAQGVLYILPSGLGEVYDGSAWKTVFKPTVTKIEAGVTDEQIATAKAVKDYVDNLVTGGIGALGALAKKDEVTETELGDALKKKINDAAAQASTLVGEDASKSARAIAAEEVAKIVDGADASFDTLKEIADWISGHKTDAASMNSAIKALEAIVDGIGGTDEPATVVAYVTAAIDALKIGDYAKAADLTAAVARITDLESKVGVLNGGADVAGSVAKALADAKAYADGLAKNYDAKGAADTALASAKTYADGKAATAETNAKTYADGLAVNYDAKGSATTAETNAKAYADGLNTTMDGRVAAVETALEVGTF
jgi:hypothetical protein